MHVDKVDTLWVASSTLCTPHVYSHHICFIQGEEPYIESISNQFPWILFVVLIRICFRKNELISTEKMRLLLGFVLCSVCILWIAQAADIINAHGSVSSISKCIYYFVSAPYSVLGCNSAIFILMWPLVRFLLVEHFLFSFNELSTAE